MRKKRQEGGGEERSGVVNTEENITSPNTEFIAALTPSGRFVHKHGENWEQHKDPDQPEPDPHRFLRFFFLAC